MNLDKYFYCKFLGEVYETTWNDREFDQKSFELGNFYRTREEAENRVKALRIETAIAKRRRKLYDEMYPWLPLEVIK